jgi:hypothetical protein
MQFSSGRRRGTLPSIVAVVLSLVAPFALPLAGAAQDDTTAPAPSSVARIDALGGDVAIVRGDENATLAAAPNAPILDGDYITTGPDGRAEVGFDGRSALRIGANVQLRLVTVHPANREIQLAAGTVELRLFGDTDGRSAIDTPSVSVVPRTAGSFRVAVDGNGETAVTVRAGSVDVETPQGERSLEPGTTLLADGPAANPSIQMQPAIALDDFDGYNADRDHIYLAASAEGQYVNTNIAGIGDLNGNGNWVDDGTYGYVWMPTSVAPGWAPYRDGNWVWEDSFGWTWVAAEPWGWAPYHYGRWYFSPAYRRWAWYPPGPGRFAPAWSPALVGFVGFNVGAAGSGIGFGNIGWVPLAPFEAFHPWWGPHVTAFANTTVDVRYRNFAVAGAMTSVSRENFAGGRFGNPMVPSQEQLRSIHPVAMEGALPLVPTAANLRFTQRTVAPSLAVRPGLMNRAFAGRPEAAAMRTPFSEQQASVARVTHVAYHPAAPNAFPSYRSRPNAGAPSNDPWSRFNGYRNSSAPSYTQPQYNRQATPAYAQPQYRRPAAPAYARPARAPHPQARATHGSDDRHDR